MPEERRFCGHSGREISLYAQIENSVIGASHADRFAASHADGSQASLLTVLSNFGKYFPDKEVIYWKLFIERKEFRNKLWI